MTDVYIDQSIQKIRDLHTDILQMDKSTTTIREYISLQAERLLDAHSFGSTAVIFHLACWCKPLIGKNHEEIMNARLTPELAQQTMAAEYGFPTWNNVESLSETQFDTRFEACVDNMLHGELQLLQSALQSSPQLATQRSQYGHGATLLHYLAANGVESYRQITPMNAADIAQTLIDAGADASAKASIYGNSDVRGLLLSSAHPADAGVVGSVNAILERAMG